MRSVVAEFFAGRSLLTSFLKAVRVTFSNGETERDRPGNNRVDAAVFFGRQPFGTTDPSGCVPTEGTG
jgi:hypothetical protein